MNLSNNYVYLKYMVLLTLRIEICGYKKCLRLAQKFLIRKTQSWFLICEKFLKTYLIFKELTESLTGFFFQFITNTDTLRRSG